MKMETWLKLSNVGDVEKVDCAQESEGDSES